MMKSRLWVSVGETEGIQGARRRAERQRFNKRKIQNTESRRSRTHGGENRHVVHEPARVRCSTEEEVKKDGSDQEGDKQIREDEQGGESSK